VCVDNVICKYSNEVIILVNIKQFKPARSLETIEEAEKVTDRA